MYRGRWRQKLNWTSPLPHRINNWKKCFSERSNSIFDSWGDLCKYFSTHYTIFFEFSKLCCEHLFADVWEFFLENSKSINSISESIEDDDFPLSSYHLHTARDGACLSTEYIFLLFFWWKFFGHIFMTMKYFYNYLLISDILILLCQKSRNDSFNFSFFSFNFSLFELCLSLQTSNGAMLPKNLIQLKKYQILISEKFSKLFDSLRHHLVCNHIISIS